MRLVILAALWMLSSAAPTPRSAALHLSDLPAGFVQSGSKVWGNSAADQSAHVAIGTTARHGRLTGYETQFKRSALVGLLEVDDTVNEYRNSAGADWAMRVLTSAIKKTVYQGRRFAQFSVGSFGGTATGYQWRGKNGGVSFEIDIVVFRRGAFEAQIGGTGVDGSFDVSQVLTLAQKIETRLRV